MTRKKDKQKILRETPADYGKAVEIYVSPEGVQVDVKLEKETIWLTQKQISELFDTERSSIAKHLRNIFKKGELIENSVCATFAQTATDGKTYQTLFFNLDAIISVGYRVKSHRGTQFRIWATQRLREFIIKGFALDDERLKRNGGGTYFEELLARIRDIRSSEKVFWRKVLDIYATSIDYEPSTEASQQFFATVQNKMHWAAHGQTAAEVIARRADAARPHMGLTSWLGSRPRKEDVAVAKNYLAAEELDALNRIVTAYVEFAELQARARRPMYMRDWIVKLDDFLRLSERDILTHAGQITHEAALAKAESEYEKYRVHAANEPSRGELDFDAAVQKLKQLEPGKGQPEKPRRHKKG